jgi:hypothetical protein
MFVRPHYLSKAKHTQSKESYAALTVGTLKGWYAYRLFYIFDPFLIKMSILLFYRYVTSVHKSFYRIVKALMVIVVASHLGCFIAAIFACNPPSDAWDFDVFFGAFYGRFATQCYDPTKLWYFTASFNLVTDCIIWILPIPFVLNLQSMDMRRRLELAGIFSIGVVAIAASAVRLWVLTEWASGWEKQGQNTANLLIWGQVEQHAGIIAASIPFLRPLVRKAFRLRRERQQSPLPVAKLIPAPQRTPIIPSPSPTFGSSNSQFKAPPSPLSPIRPISHHITIGSAV